MLNRLQYSYCQGIFKCLCISNMFVMQTRLQDKANLLKIVDNLNSHGPPEKKLLVLFDIVHLFPNIDI